MKNNLEVDVCNGGFVNVADEIDTSALGHGTVTWRDEVWEVSRCRRCLKRVVWFFPSTIFNFISGGMFYTDGN